MLKTIIVTHFRNVTQTKTITCGFSTLIHGPNASGKTNLLEAIYVLNYARGFRSGDIRDLFSYDSTECSVEGEYDFDGKAEHYKVYMKNGTTIEKALFINGIKKPYKAFGQRTVPIVLFQPSDLMLVTSSPSVRRSYVDTILFTSDPLYKQSKTNYDHGLYKRNKMLTHMHRSDFGSVIGFWDSFLEKNAKSIQDKRASLAQYFNKHAEFEGMEFHLEYEPNPYTPELSLAHRDRDIRTGRTSFGLQLDELTLYKRNGQTMRRLASYGSRSEQRLGVLWLKRTELLYLVEVLGVHPMLLLDDVFSELDAQNSKRIVHIARSYQTIMTTAHLDMLDFITYPMTRIEL